MNNTFTTTDEYIKSFDIPSQDLLQKIRTVIKKVAPVDAKEMINYQMPTFRYNGNLIHYALFKKHLGLYPGTAAIEHFANELMPFKTSKGAIQLPLDQPLPEQLITDIVHFNVQLLQDKNAPKWNTHNSKWDACEELMNQLILKIDLKKTFKWGTDIYTFNNKNIIGWRGFKDFFSLWFYNGVFLKDEYKVLVSASEGKTKSLRQWRFKNIKEMDENKILAYILESIQTVKDGKEIKATKTTPRTVSGFLKDALKADRDLELAFQTLTMGRQKEYIEYIEDAKQAKTKVRRLEKISPLIFEGKGLHDKYKK